MNKKMRFLISLATFVCAVPLAARDASPIAAQEILTRDGARAVISAATAKAKALSAPGSAIAVVDAGGNLIALERLDGTFAAGSLISYGKARTAALFKKPTRVFEDIVNKGRTAMTTLSDFTPLKGGVPILSNGQIIGAVGVSGAASADQDDEIATSAASAFSSSTASSMDANASPAAAMLADKVEYFANANVEASFSKGSVLLDFGHRNFAIHTSRRVEPGQAEIHTLETDVIHVIDGEATFVTGGKAIDPKPTAPNELRGSGIEGGETHQLHSGDVIVVPAGVPHWFKAVAAPLHYYVVKVRSESHVPNASVSDTNH